MLYIFLFLREDYYECGDSCNHFTKPCNGACINGTVPCGDECRLETEIASYYECGDSCNHFTKPCNGTCHDDDDVLCGDKCIFWMLMAERYFTPLAIGMIQIPLKVMNIYIIYKGQTCFIIWTF